MASATASRQNSARDAAKRLVLEFRYDVQLLSADRSWLESLVQAQKIVNVRDSTDSSY